MMARRKPLHPMFDVGPGCCSDTMKNSFGNIYEPTLYAMRKQFPELIHNHTHPEIILRLILAGVIENQGHIHVGPKLRAEFGVNEKGARI